MNDCEHKKTGLPLRINLLSAIMCLRKKYTTGRIICVYYSVWCVFLQISTGGNYNMSEKRMLMPYLFNEKSVRVFEYGGEVWFVARDVGKALGMGNIRTLMSRVLTRDEYIYVSKVYDKERRAWTALVLKQDKLNEHCTNLVAINESGLYTLIMRSSKPEALKFRQWVTSEVLPSLRKTGRYEMPEKISPSISEDMPQIKINANIALSGGLKEVSDALTKITAILRSA